MSQLMKRFYVGCALLITAALLASPTVFAGDPPLTGEQIMERYIEATVGRAAYEKLSSRHSVMSIEFQGMGLALDVEVFQKRPNLFYSRASSDATGDVERGTDGTTFWEMSTMGGPRILEGTEAADALREATFDQLVDWKTLYKSAEYVGSDTVDGVFCHKVLLTPEQGSSQTLFFDAQTGLVVQLESVVEHPMGEIPIVVKMSDYREVDGIKVPFVSEIQVMGQSRLITQKVYEHNVEMDDSLFVIPADIQALMTDQPAETE